MSVKQFIPVAVLCATAGTGIMARADWGPDYRNYSIQRLGLLGAERTGISGYQYSEANFLNGSGQVAGISWRINGVNSVHGQDAWVWNGATLTQVGLVGPGFTGGAGYQFSAPLGQNAAGQVIGYSSRIIAMLLGNGRSAWVWNGTTTTEIGLIGPGYTGSGGYQNSIPFRQNAQGQVSGASMRYTGVNTYLGQDAWIWNGTTTTQVGLTSGDNTSSTGERYSSPVFQNDGGQVVGYSIRYTGVNTNNGRNVWAWNGTTTTQIGLVGSANTRSTGYQFSEARFQSNLGHVTGVAERYTAANSINGIDTWFFDGATTRQIALIGVGYTGNTGYQRSTPHSQNASGQVAGSSWRVIGTSSYAGEDAWVWNGTTTMLVGLTGAGYTSSSGYRYNIPQLQNASGQVAGITTRISGSEATNGQDAWAWNGTTTVQIGLTGAGYTGTAGFRVSDLGLQNDAGQVAGTSRRVTGENTNNGRDAWAWNGLTTSMIGLTGSAYTGSAGYRDNAPWLQNASGIIVGIATRFTGVDTNNGQDLWYFDPRTGVTTAVVGSVRANDSYAYAEPTILTDSGFLLGNYRLFAESDGPGERRAFIFRPDLGITDLGSLVDGGLTLNGWSTLRNPVFMDAFNTIVGHGYVNGQTTGQSVFVMNIPTPGVSLLVGLGGSLVLRRRR